MATCFRFSVSQSAEVIRLLGQGEHTGLLVLVSLFYLFTAFRLSQFKALSPCP